MKMLSRFNAAVLIMVALNSAACVKAKPPIDTGDDSTATNPIAPTPDPGSGPSDQTAALAYNQDMKATFAADCVSCHGSGRADGGYRMATYAQVMTDVRPGNAFSILVQVTQSNGSMYRYFSGTATTRQAKSDAVRTWIVTYNAQENR